MISIHQQLGSQSRVTRRLPMRDRSRFAISDPVHTNIVLCSNKGLLAFTFTAFANNRRRKRERSFCSTSNFYDTIVNREYEVAGSSLTFEFNLTNHGSNNTRNCSSFLKTRDRRKIKSFRYSSPRKLRKNFVERISSTRERRVD